MRIPLRMCVSGLAAVTVIWAQQLATGQALRLVSLPNSSNSPASAGGDSYAPIMSRDGRFVLFASSANNLVASSTNTALLAHQPPNLNVFLRDRANGTTTLVSINALGTGGGNADSLPVNVSTNGRYVLFESSASDLVAGDTNQTTDIFLRDLAAGTTFLVSINTNGVAGNGESRSPAMTPDAEEGAWDARFYRHVTNETEMLYPTPAETWVYMDEHPDSMNDPAIFSPLSASWVDVPATYHNGAANVVFADGHTEVHQWVGSLTSPPARQVSTLGLPHIPVAPGDPDLHWMSYHTSRVSTNSY